MVEKPFIQFDLIYTLYNGMSTFYPQTPDVMESFLVSNDDTLFVVNNNNAIQSCHNSVYITFSDLERVFIFFFLRASRESFQYFRCCISCSESSNNFLVLASSLDFVCRPSCSRSSTIRESRPAFRVVVFKVLERLQKSRWCQKSDGEFRGGFIFATYMYSRIFVTGARANDFAGSSPVSRLTTKRASHILKRPILPDETNSRVKSLCHPLQRG